MQLYHLIENIRQGFLRPSLLTQKGILALLFITALYPAAIVADVSTPLSISVTPSAIEEPSQSIVVLGDSISAGYGIQRDQGWVHLLNQELARHEPAWFAVNASISGETTGGGLARLKGVLQAHLPCIVIIELGGNDGLRGYPIGKIRENLTAMVDLISASGAIPIIVAMRIPPNYGARYSQAFEGVFAEVAEAKDTGFVPFLLAKIALADELMQADGIHPSAAAQPLLLDAVWPRLQPLL